MKIIVELVDASSSTTTHFEELLAEELSQVLGPRGFSVKQLQIVQIPEAKPEVSLRKDGEPSVAAP